MKKLKISSFTDHNFLRLGLFCVFSGWIVLLLSFYFKFDSIIAIRGGFGLGLIICVTHWIARFKEKK